MARKRMLDPSWIESQSLGKCTLSGRLLFFGLITLADDEGRLRGDPAFLRHTIFPYDENISTQEIVDDLNDLQEFGSIQHYSINGQSFICLPKWHDYQKIDRKTVSKLPECPQNWVKKTIIECSSRARRGLDESSSNARRGLAPNRIEYNRIEENLNIPPEDSLFPEIKDKEKNSGSPSEKPATNEVATKTDDPDRELKQKIENSFIAVSGKFASYGKERENIKRIITAARRDCPDRTEEYIKAMLEKFRQLTNSNDKFYSKIEFTPTKMVGCWTNIKKLLQVEFGTKMTPEQEEMIERMCRK